MKGRMTHACLAAAVAVAAAIATVCICLQIPGISVDIARNYNEGWMLQFASRLLEGMPLYADSQALMVNNYPPLWYLLLAAFGRIGLEINAAGRMVEFAAFLSCGLLVYLISMRLALGRIAALSGAAVFLGATTAWVPSYIGINDPHFLGLALMLCGAWLALNRTTGSLLIAAVVCCVGGFVKHSLLAVPVSIFLCFLLTDRRSFWIFSMALGAFVALGLVICTAVWGSDFWGGIFSARTYELWRLRLHFEQQALFYIAVLVAGVVAICIARAHKLLLWPVIYLAVSVLLAMIFQLGAGISGNHNYDTLVAFALVFAASFGHVLHGAPGKGLWMAGAALVLLVGTFARTAEPLFEHFSARADRQSAALEVVRTLRGLEGTVACEDAVLCMRAGRFSELDFFNIGQRLQVGELSMEELLGIFHARNVTAIQFFGVPGSSDRLTQDQIAILLAAYPRQLVSNRYYSLYAVEQGDSL